MTPGIGAAVLLAGVMLLFGCGSLQPLGGAGDADHPAVAVAAALVGTPYRYGGASPEGFDCSGLIHYAFHQAGYAVPRTTGALYRRALPVQRWDLRPGDLLFFVIDGKVDHVGLYAGEGSFIHAPSSGKSVSFGSLSNAYWRERLVRAGRL